MNPVSPWRYLTATELAYRKRFIMITYCVAVVVLAGRWFSMLNWASLADSPERLAAQVELSLWLTIAAGALVTHGLFSGFKRQRRNRLLTPMPVAPRAVVASRLLTVLTVHAIPLAVWSAGYALLRITSDYDGSVSVSTLPPQVYEANFWTLLSFFAISVYVCLLVALAHNWKKPSWGNLLFWIGALLATNFLIYPAGSSPEIFLPGYSVFHSAWGALYYWAAAAALAGTNAFVCLRKNTI
jgi:hypothetical protein